MVQLPDLPGGLNMCTATDVSDDGAVIAGTGFIANNGVRPCRWTLAASGQWVVQSLDSLRGGSDGQATGISADGNAIVGIACPSPTCMWDRGFIWMAPTGPMVALGDLPGGLVRSYAHAITPEGSTIVGDSHGIPTPGSHACRWRLARGQWIPEDIGDLPGGSSQSYAYAVSGDGTVIVGASSSAQFISGEAYRWVEPGPMQGLGDLAGGESRSRAFGVSADGSIVVGEAMTDLGPTAFIWDAIHGMRNLTEVLQDLGVVEVEGWTLRHANDISADGTVIVGMALNQTRGFEAFRAVVPILVDLVSANPPASSPYSIGGQPFRDVLQTGPGADVTQGIGAAGTPSLGGVVYSPISVTFNAPPTPVPTTQTITITCTDSLGNGPADCPHVQTVTGSGVGPYQITLDGPIPPVECTTIAIAGVHPASALRYQSLPGDVNLDGTTTLADKFALQAARQNGTADDPADLARYDINRSGSVTGQDVARLMQLLNGANAPMAFGGLSVAECE